MVEISEKLQQRRQRLERYAQSIRLRPGHPIFDALEAGKLKSQQVDPAETEKVRTQGIAIGNAYLNNGPNLPADTYLRQLLSEYNNRLFMGEGANQPTSFNVMRAFVEPDERSLVLRLLTENVYLADVSAVLDLVTDPKNSFNPSDFAELPELEIFELNFISSPVTFQTSNHPDLVAFGISCVREGSELSVIGIFGKQVGSFKKEAVPADKESLWPGKEFLLEGKDEIDLSDIPMLGNNLITPLITMVRLDIESNTVQVRYVMHEKADVYNVSSDDPDVLIPLLSRKNYSEIRDFHLAEIGSYSELIDSTISLSQFFMIGENYEDEIQLERHPTLFKLSSSRKLQKMRKNLNPKDAPNYVNISVLHSLSSTEKFNLSGANLKIEKTGHWRTLDSNQKGTDKQGNIVHGKTWVETEKRWDEFAVNVPEMAKRSIPIEIPNSEKSGWIYVLRNASHPRDTYKVGFTTKTPEERAAQLGSTSGQVDVFNVVQDWQVNEPRKVESEIHRKLSQYRVNSKREFFSLKYPKIREVVEATIQEFDAFLSD